MRRHCRRDRPHGSLHPDRGWLPRAGRLAAAADRGCRSCGRARRIRNAYDLYLSRTLKHAQLVHAPSSPGAIELFVSEKLDAAAGVKQQLLAFAKTHRMCTGRFMAIEQTMGTPKAGMWEPVMRGASGSKFSSDLCNPA